MTHIMAQGSNIGNQNLELPKGVLQSKAYVSALHQHHEQRECMGEIVVGENAVAVGDLG